ncbi:MAG: ATP-binding protein [Desulfuromonas sp.]|nr:ATP-binding protein [Desulfuromonas sp.]
MNSIRKRLMRWLLIGQLLAVVLSGTITFFYVRGEIEDLFDDRLRQLAYSIPTHGNFVPTEQLPLTEVQNDDDDFVIQIWQDDGTMLLHRNRSEGTPALAPEGFSNHFHDAMLWRSFVLRRGDKLVQASQPFSDRLEVSTSVALRAIVPIVTLIFILGILVRISVNYGLSPLNTLTKALEKIRPYSLEPLSSKGLPDEVIPLVLVLNDLLTRLDTALHSQRKFVADAAHELRTPLAAVQLQTQLLQKVSDADERQQALLQIRAGTARATHLVQQLLTLARLEPEDLQRPFASTDLSALIKSVVSEQAQAAMARQIDLGVSEDQPIAINADAESLRVMLSNLIDNALRYTPPGGQVDVAVRHLGWAVQLEVVDNGPGIPAAERKKVFDRFYRRPGTNTNGSGLGLAIVQEVVTRHHGKIALTTAKSGHGLQITITLPLPP